MRVYARYGVKKYGVGSFFFDLFMIAITGGLWLLWVFVREMRQQY